MEKSVCWSDWDGEGLEHCTVSHGPEGLRLEGSVVGTREGRYGAFYTVITDGEYCTRELRINYVAGPALHVKADGKGRWYDTLADKPIAALDGCLDVDIGVTPATNTLPIKRLRLKQGEHQDIIAAYVPLPSQIEGRFLPRRVEQRYTCFVPEQCYRYEGLFRGYSAELEIDDFGLVIDYPDTFRRVWPR